MNRRRPTARGLRHVYLTLAMLAVALKVLIPAGFMAAPAKASELPFAIVLCTSQGMVTVDAGFKAMSTDADPPQVVAGAPEGSRYFFMGDEHGALVPSSGSPPLGARVTLAAPHCDPTVNLYDAYHVVEGDTLVAIWPVTARGRSR